MNAQLKPERMANGLDARRVGRITGSRVGAILGLNPYSKRDDVLREMVREFFGAAREFIGNEATEYGKAMEPTALAKYEAQTGTMTYGGDDLLIHPVYDFLAVTPDGLVGSDGMVECKAPFRGHYTHWQDKPYYEAQMRLQLECSRRKWCDFVVLDRHGNIHVSRLVNDPDWLPRNLGTLQNFRDEVIADTASREAAARHLGGKDREDRPWREAANDYLGALAAFNDLDAIVKSKREVLLALAGDQSAKGSGVQVIRSERAGSVAYAKALKDLAPDADLTPYTGKPAVIFTIKESKA